MFRATRARTHVVISNGNVASGALDMLKELPIQFVKTKDLPQLVSDPSTSRTIIRRPARLTTQDV